MFDFRSNINRADLCKPYGLFGIYGDTLPIYDNWRNYNNYGYIFLPHKK